MRRIILFIGSLLFIVSCGVKGPPEPPLPTEGSLSKTSSQNSPSPKPPEETVAPGDNTAGRPSTPASGKSPNANTKQKKKATKKAGSDKGQ